MHVIGRWKETGQTCAFTEGTGTERLRFEPPNQITANSAANHSTTMLTDEILKLLSSNCIRVAEMIVSCTVPTVSTAW